MTSKDHGPIGLLSCLLVHRLGAFPAELFFDDWRPLTQVSKLSVDEVAGSYLLNEPVDVLKSSNFVHVVHDPERFIVHKLPGQPSDESRLKRYSPQEASRKGPSWPILLLLTLLLGQYP